MAADEQGLAAQAKKRRLAAEEKKPMVENFEVEKQRFEKEAKKLVHSQGSEQPKKELLRERSGHQHYLLLLISKDNLR